MVLLHADDYMIGSKLRRHTWAVAGVLAATLFLCYGSALASHSVEVTVGPPRTATPGELVTHVFTVSNTGTEADEFSLVLTTPQGWTALPIDPVISLAPGESRRLFVTLMIPPGAAAGSYATELRATSLADPTQSAVAQGIVELLPVVDLQLEAVRVDRAAPGSEARHTVRVTNRGNVADTYRLAARSSPDWTTRVSPAEVTVLPGAHRDVTVSVLVPHTARPGESYRTRVEVTSQTDPALARTIWIYAVVAPALPDDVRVDFYPQIPLAFRFSLTEVGDPRLRLSLSGTIPTVGRVSGSRSLSILGTTGQSASFHTADWGFDWGNVSLSGAFGSLGGHGLAVFWYEPDRSTAEVVWTDEGKGIGASLGCAWGHLRFLILDLEGLPARTITEVHLQAELDSFSFSGVLATGWQGGIGADAYRLRPTMRVDGLSGFLEVAKVSRDFPGQMARETFGWGMRAGSAAAALHGEFATIKTVALTDPGPPQVHTTTQEFTTAIGLRPSPRMSGSLALSMESEESDDASTDQGSRQLSLRLTDMGPVVAWSLSGTHRITWDDIANTGSSAIGVRVSARAALGQLTARGALSVDRLGPSDFASSLSLGCSFPEVPFTPSLGMSVSGDGQTTLTASISWTDVGGWHLSANLELPLEGGFSFSAAFTVPISFRLLGPIYGSIRGRAFVDVNGSGTFDPGDEPVAGLLIEANGQLAISGRDGRFVFTPMLPGRYQVTIEDLPFGVRPTVRLPIAVNVQAGRFVDVAIPLDSVSMIRGTVYHDLDQDGRRDPGESGVAGVRLLIESETVREHVRTDSGGRFSLEVPAGTYTVELDEATLPARYEPTTPTRIQVRVEERKSISVEFGVWQRPRPVIVAPVAPVARFDHEPRVPRTGEEVTLDATQSRPSEEEEEIVSYAWELRMGASVIRTHGETVTVVFDEAGIWLVTLRIEDSAGRTGRTQRTITVR